MKKKKFKFDVSLSIEELNSIPYVTGVLFCKARLLSGGDFSSLTQRSNIASHSVKWKSSFKFSSKLSSAAGTGILETCLCRISVRKEVKGGKSHEKLGYVDVNLAEYAGSGSLSRRYILEGYEGKTYRQDNSILKITASMMLTSGDPLFKPQEYREQPVSSSNVDTDGLSAGAYPQHRLSGLEMTDQMKRSQSDAVARDDVQSPVLLQHYRSSSNGSNVFAHQATHSRNSSVDKRSSMIHSREPSSASNGDSACADLDMTHMQSPIQSRGYKRSGDVYKRIDETRVNADDMIDKLINGADLTRDSTNADEGIDVSLFLENDGVSTMSKIETRRRRHDLRPEDRFKTL